jgi:hypothetical protein
MAKGGARNGAGRPSKAKELHTAEVARAVIKAKYGSLEKGLESLLCSTEPSLVKFVFEHAFGKSPDKIEHSGNTAINLNIVRGKLTT